MGNTPVSASSGGASSRPTIALNRAGVQHPDGTLEAALAEIEEEQLQKVHTRNPHNLSPSDTHAPLKSLSHGTPNLRGHLLLPTCVFPRRVARRRDDTVCTLGRAPVETTTQRTH
jgi:hypothetical protein